MAVSAVSTARKRSFSQMHGADSAGLVRYAPMSVPSSRHSSPAIEPDFGYSAAQSGLPQQPNGQHFIPDAGPLDLAFPSGTFDVNTGIPRTTSFVADSTVTLIGIRGVGKSSLAVLAAAAYDRKLIEFEHVFRQATGLSSPAYRKTHGTSKFQQTHASLLEKTLHSNTKGSIIVCTFADIEGRGAAIIREFAQSHPVIHVTRDATGIQSHLSMWSKDRISDLLRTSKPLLQQSTNYDFFNLSEAMPKELKNGLSRSDQVSDQKQRSVNGPYLTLKRVERDFLKLLRNILGDYQRGPSHHSAYPLSQIAVEDRSHTYSVKISVQDVLSGTLDLDDAQIGADAFELVVDDSKGALQRGTDDDPIGKAFAIIRRATILPIILTVEKDELRLSLGGKLESDLSEQCLRLGPEYFTLNLGLSLERVETLAARRGNIRIIAAYEWPTRPAYGWHDDECRAMFEHAKRLRCNVLKLVMPAVSHEDNFAAQTFRQAVEPYANGMKITTWCLGSIGRASWCFSKTLTPVQPPGFGESLARALMPRAMLTTQALTRTLFTMFVFEPMRFLIYGANTGYSLSPAMHNAAYRACGMPHTYETFSSKTLEAMTDIARERSFGGAAITQPFKLNVISMLDALSPHAHAIGAVNTIVPLRELGAGGTIPDELGIISQRNRQGPVKALYGDNTDWIGIRACLRRGLSPANTVRPQSTGLVCGAGGMARAAVYAMLSLGIRTVFICNRTTENARTVADHYNSLLATGTIAGVDTDGAHVQVIDDFAAAWPQDWRHPTLIVVSIPAQPTDSSPPANFTLPVDWLRSPTGGVVLELAYRPLVTPLVRQMRAEAHRGWILMDGFDMLPEQGFSQFELFTGRRAPRKVMREEALKRYRREQEATEQSAGGTWTD